MAAATQPAEAPSLDAILAARGVVAIPGLLHWLGYSDDQQSLDEDYEDFCNRISKAVSG